MTNERTVILPSFTYSRFNPEEVGSPSKFFIESVAANYSTFENNYADKDLIIIGIREKIDNDYRYAMCAVGIDEKHSIIHVKASKYNLPPLIISDKNSDVINTAVRIINQKAFL